jgi:hypothetical protein
MTASIKVVQSTCAREYKFKKVAGHLLAAFCILMTAAAIVAGQDNRQGQEPLSTFMTGQIGTPAPLSEKELRKYRKMSLKINKIIRQGPCQNFLARNLGEAIIDRITDKLAAHQAFSGPRSTEIKAVDSGIYAYSMVMRMFNLTGSSDPPVAKAAQYEVGRSVAQLFANNNGANGRTMAAAVANYNGNPNTAFYRSLDAVELLHEILHVATALNDNDLATKLGIDITPFNGDYEQASDAITKALKHNRCD